MSSIYLESSGLTLETQPEFLGEYWLEERSDEEILKRKKHMQYKSTGHKLRSYQTQMDFEDNSSIYYQKGKFYQGKVWLTACLTNCTEQKTCIPCNTFCSS